MADSFQSALTLMDPGIQGTFRKDGDRTSTVGYS
jgi:hypothetical protein